MIMMPSSAILTTPLRSLNIPPNATISSGMEKNIVCCTRKYTVFIQLRPLPAGPCPKQRACRPPLFFSALDAPLYKAAQKQRKGREVDYHGNNDINDLRRKAVYLHIEAALVQIRHEQA